MPTSAEPPTILVVNGPNLNMLGTREPHLYGSTTLAMVLDRLQRAAGSGDPALRLIPFQSNHEGAIIDFLQEHGPACSGIIINAGAFTHYSYALRDALASIHAPTVEVHITNIHARERFRHHSVLAEVVAGQVVGLGTSGYDLALTWLRERLAGMEGQSA